MTKSECNTVNICSFLNVLLSRFQRHALGCFVLILVDILWALSSEIVKKLYMQKYNDFEKPFFTTYIRSSLFTIYLFKFFYWSPLKSCNQPPGDYMKVDQHVEDESYFTDQTEPPGELVSWEYSCY
ncbi:hypothetical protein M8J77_015761 [Diaphorina citri]|nr:hypothetical protein M8J77_015761 [Diaphorina citri]